MNEIARIPPGGRQELGLINWAISRIAARKVRAPHMHLFEVLGYHKMLFWTFLPYAGQLLNKGKLPKTDTELIILRVGHLRGSEYELQQHRRLARSRGVDDALQEKIFAGPARSNEPARRAPETPPRIENFFMVLLLSRCRRGVRGTTPLCWPATFPTVHRKDCSADEPAVARTGDPDPLGHRRAGHVLAVRIPTGRPPRARRS